MNIRVLISFLLVFISFFVQKDVHARIADNPRQQSSLVFVENKGQITDQHDNVCNDIDFKLNAPGINIFIGNGQLHYQWAKSIDSTSTEIYRLDVSLIGANTNAEVIAENKQGYYENYYLPSTPDGATAHSYKKITYKNIYPNIDWVLYINANVLKYDFVVHEGGNVKDIRMEYNGATALQMQDGALQVTTPFGSIIEQEPYSYNAKTKEKITSSYKLNKNILSFNIENITDEIVIDPQLDWATYYGGSGSDGDLFTISGPPISGGSITTDNLGFVYMVGGTNSTNNIAITGAHKSTVTVTDGFIVKFDDVGIRQWATYYGGDSTDILSSVVCGSDNSVYVAGYSHSLNGIATTGAHQTSWVGNGASAYDGILAKFDANGNRIWGTYFGGSGVDMIRQMAISVDDELYLTGYTHSYTGIATTGAFQTTYGNAFLAKFSASGARQWATYYSDSININQTYASQGISVACDKNKDVYLAGATYSKTNIATTNSHQPVYFGDHDAYLVKFNSSGQRIWGTYYGGLFSDVATDIVCDDSANVYMVGLTHSRDSISSVTGFIVGKPQLPSQGDGFMVKFTSAGKRLWATYLGGYIGSVFIDRNDDVCVVGSGNLATFNMTTAGAWKSTPGGTDGQLVKFDKTGVRLWGTYFGGNGGDVIYVAHGDKSNNLYLAGQTNSTSFVSTTGSHQPLYGGGTSDDFLIKALPDSVVFIEPVDTLICTGPNGGDVDVRYSVSRSFRVSNVFTAQLSNSLGSFAAPVNIGSDTATASGTISCHIPASVPLGTGYRIRVTASAPFYISTDNGKNIEIRLGPAKPEAYGDTSVCEKGVVHLYANCATPGVSYSWIGPAFNSFNQNPVIPSVIANGTGNYIVTVLSNACRTKDTVHIVVKPLPEKPITIDYAPICEGSSLTLAGHTNDTGNLYYIWYRPSQVTDTTDSLTISAITKNDAGDYVLVINRAGCSNADTVNIVVKRLPIITVSSNSPLRVGSDLHLDADVDSGDAIYGWLGPYNYNSNEGHTVRKSIDKNSAGVYTVTATVDGCSVSKQLLVVVDDGLKQSEYFEINPNPNKGIFTLSGIVLNDQLIQVEVVNILGQTIYTASTSTVDKHVSVTITLPDVAQGEYFLRIRVSNKNKAYRFVVSK